LVVVNDASPSKGFAIRRADAVQGVWRQGLGAQWTPSQARR
jgi:hypothetical protein